jgi:hypothetical protein
VLTGVTDSEAAWLVGPPRAAVVCSSGVWGGGKARAGATSASRDAAASAEVSSNSATTSADQPLSRSPPENHDAQAQHW